MPSGSGHLLAALLHADGTLPSGGFAFSWGLETLYAERRLDEQDHLQGVLSWYLQHRWATFDRYFVSRSLRADLDGRLELDRMEEVETLSGASRAASVRAGRALLSTWARAGSTAASEYKEALTSGSALGHLSIVQGLLYADAGLSEPDAAAVSGWNLISGLSSAAVRLGAVGASSAHRQLWAVMPLLSGLVDRPPPESPHSWMIMQDIAMDRHWLQSVRLFAS